MISTQDFSVLIGHIYDCALDEAHWPATLARLCETFRGSRADVSILDGLTGAAEVQFYHNYSPALIEAIHVNSPLNPLMPLVLVHPMDSPFFGERSYGIEAFRKTLYYRNALTGIDVVDVMLLPMARKVSVGAAVHISRSSEVGFFDNEDEALARLLIPHLERAVDVSRLLKRANAAEATIEGMLGAMSAPAFLLARDGTIRHCNAAAEEELRRGTLLRATEGKLAGRNPAVSRFLAGLDALGPETRRCSDVLIRTEDRGEVLITAVELSAPADSEAASTLLVVRAPEPDLVSPISVAKDAFALTSAEVLTLGQIVAGRSLQEAADLIGIARSTVKSHLDSIFLKANVSKQSELVGKVMSLMRPLP